VPLLSRVWQMFVKGMEEVSRSGSPVSAAEMVLIRIAHTADLPSPEDIIRALGAGGGAGAAGRPAAPAGGGSGGGTRPALNERPTSTAPTGQRPAGPVAVPRPEGPAQPPPARPEDYGAIGDDEGRWEAGADDDAGEEVSDPGDAIGSRPVHVMPDPRSYPEVVALVGQMRDPRLKIHLEDHTSLVKFDAAAPSIDLFLLPEAPSEIANELREKLNRWTQRRWVVVLSKTRGETPLGEVRRAREAAELEDLKRHPAVAAVLAVFPDAKIADVRHLAVKLDDETGTG
jgi:DNA polymerase-3 subunit gamma/tau